MPLKPGKHSLGPEQGTIEVRTYREGMAKKVGHDLIMEVGRWQATVEVGEDGAPSAIALEIDSRSLEVREGLHGVKPLTDKDGATIRGEIGVRSLQEHAAELAQPREGSGGSSLPGATRLRSGG